MALMDILIWAALFVLLLLVFHALDRARKSEKRLDFIETQLKEVRNWYSRSLRNSEEEE